MIFYSDHPNMTVRKTVKHDKPYEAEFSVYY